MKLTNIKKLIIGVVAEFIMLITATRLYNFLMFTDGIQPPAVFLNVVLLIVVIFGLIINYLYIYDDVDLD